MTGSASLWTTETAAGLFTKSGGTGSSLATPTVTTDTAATDVLTVGTGTGAITITDTSTGATAAFTATGAPVVIAVNDSNLFYSPFNWLFSGSTYAKTVNPGAYLRAKITGTTSLAIAIDVSSYVAASVASQNYPTFQVSIDGGAYQETLLTSATTAVTLSGLSTGAHTVFITWSLPATNTDRWVTPTCCLKITSLTLDFGGSLSSPTLRPNRWLCYGDSITEGSLIIPPSGIMPSMAYQVMLAQANNAEYGTVAFSGQGYETLGGGSVPTFLNAWNLLFSGQTRLVSSLLSPAPDVITICHGTNGTTTSADVQSITASLRTAAPSAWILHLIPPGYLGASPITAGVAAYNAANPSETKVKLIDIGASIVGGTLLSPDGTHLSAFGHAVYGTTLSKLIQAATAPGGGGGNLFNSGGLIR